jgi:Fe-S oxidoreductase
MLRAAASRQKSRRTRLTTQALSRTDLAGRIGTRTAPVANAVLSRAGSRPRRLMEATLGVASERVLPPYARERFSTWFKRQGRSAPQAGPGGLDRIRNHGQVAVFASCLVEYQNPAVGRDLVKVYERNGIACELAEGVRCCGAPWLHSGEFEPFKKQATHNVAALAKVARQGKDIVVPQPTCGYVLKRDYPEYLGTDDAALVAARTFDAAEYLWRLDKGEGTQLDRRFDGHVPSTVAYHAPCHLQAQNIGLRSRDLLKMTGAKVTTIQKCSGIDGMWGLRAENYDLARRVAGPLADAVSGSGAEAVAGDCHLANGAIEQETGRAPVHPIQLLARAYGIPEEP